MPQELMSCYIATLRAYHPEIIFGSMETIMTLVIEESEDISTDLLAPLLATLRRNNKVNTLCILPTFLSHVL